MQRNKLQPSFKGRFKIKRRREDEKGILFAAVCWMTAILLAGCGGQQDKAASTYPEPLAQEQYEHLFA